MQVNISSSSDSSCGDDSPRQTKRVCPTVEAEPTMGLSPQEALLRKARTYQEYMKGIPVPTKRGSAIPFTSWTGLGMSIKELYKQPFHYLTNTHLRQLDRMRLGAEDEDTPLDFLVHPIKAEASIWLMEEFHRKTASPDHIAKLWLGDPVYDMYIDPVPKQAGSLELVVMQQ